MLQAKAPAVTDYLAFGNEKSEKAHAFADGGRSFKDTGLYGESCRRIRKPEQSFWRAGPMAFTLKVKPEERNYITYKFSGNDMSRDMLFMTIDGKVLGQLHLGQYDVVDYEPEEAPYTNRWMHSTFLIPTNATADRVEIRIQLFSCGRVWGYGQNFEQFQKQVHGDSRGIYSVTIHRDPLCPETKRERLQIKVPPHVPVDPPPIDIEKVKELCNHHLERYMGRERGLLKTRGGAATFLADGYNTPWTVAYRNPRAVEAMVEAVDHVGWKYHEDPKSVVQNGSWTGPWDVEIPVPIFGPKAFAPYLDREIERNGTKMPRRKLWGEMYLANVKQLTTHRRFFGNQGQIVDMSGHWANRCAHMCGYTEIPLETTRTFVKQSMGMEPCPNGYVALTPAALSKEDGYVGKYGESTIWAANFAMACTKNYETGELDKELLPWCRKAIESRLIFRYPGVDPRGRKLYRLESQIGWRNEHMPGEHDYLDRHFMVSPLFWSKSKIIFGAIVEQVADGWFEDSVMRAVHKKDRSGELMKLVTAWPSLEKALARAKKEKGLKFTMPMGGEDFVWCDSENAVVALKNGDEVLYVNSYWRAKGLINGLAKIHYVTPRGDWVATIYQDEEFEQARDKSGNPRVEMLHNYFAYGWKGKLYNGYRAEDPNWAEAPSWPPKSVDGGILRPVGERGGRATHYHVSFGDYEVYINDHQQGEKWRIRIPQGTWRVLAWNVGGEMMPPPGKSVKGGKTVPLNAGTCLVLRRTSIPL
ncbi:MAG: hypothetical protein ACI4R9_04425 [Kiritimatiellia bacterium]